jgi:hypothetical protein
MNRQIRHLLSPYPVHPTPCLPSHLCESVCICGYIAALHLNHRLDDWEDSTDGGCTKFTRITICEISRIQKSVVQLLLRKREVSGESRCRDFRSGWGLGDPSGSVVATPQITKQRPPSCDCSNHRLDDWEDSTDGGYSTRLLKPPSAKSPESDNLWFNFHPTILFILCIPVRFPSHLRLSACICGSISLPPLLPTSLRSVRIR